MGQELPLQIPAPRPTEPSMSFNWTVRATATETYEYTTPEVWNYATSWEKLRDDWHWVVLPNFHPSGNYLVDQYKVYLDVAWYLPPGIDHFEENLEVLYVAANGYSGANPNDQSYWVKLDYWDLYSVKMYAFVYWIEYNLATGQTVNEWWPQQPSETEFCYKVRGMISEPNAVSGIDSGMGSMTPGNPYFITPFSITLSPAHGGSLLDIHPEPGESGDYDDSDYVISAINWVVSGYTISGTLIAVACESAPPIVSAEVIPPSPYEVYPPTKIKFALDASDEHGILAWEFEITKDEYPYEMIRHFEGLGLPPSELTWDLRDDQGNDVPEGWYRYILRAWDNCLKKAETQPQTVHVIRGIPREK